ncbi:SCO family protein [Desulfogranum japonicum]|uniref:SCO family protein n=1 Tax=Desulfogranum japonicum TaxID=231447 RepID=UPI000404780C|nr:SCO family protein [Desulfogranum japonicum]
MNISSSCSLLICLLCAIAFQCTSCSDQSANKLPVLGTFNKDFTFTNQDNQPVTPDVFKNKVVVTDFFFTTCPSICPIMKRQMHRIYEQFENHPDVLLFSHTIDPEHDTAEVLHKYAEGFGIRTEKWQMVTGSQDEIFAMAKHYMLGAMKNEEVPGGYIHSGSFVLMDKQQRIRGYYNGTDATEVDTLITDMKTLLND